MPLLGSALHRDVQYEPVRYKGVDLGRLKNAMGELSLASVLFTR